VIPNLLQTTAAVQELQVLYRQSVNKTYSQSEQFIAFCAFFSPLIPEYIFYGSISVKEKHLSLYEYSMQHWVK